jgi:hypothetical protein
MRDEIPRPFKEVTTRESYNARFYNGEDIPEVPLTNGVPREFKEGVQ